MKVLITGATGLVGRAIVAALHERGLSVNYLTTSKNKLVKQHNYTGYYWNPAEGIIDLEAFKGVTHIINLAGATIAKRWTASYKETVLQSRLNSLRTLQKGLETIDADQIQGLVAASAIGIYPNSLTNLYEERHKSIDTSFLGEVVAAWEQQIDALSSFNFALAKVRIGLVLSSQEGALPKMAQPIKNYVGAAFGTGQQWQSWIHIQDLAQLFLFVLDNKLEGTFNGVAPNPVTNSKLTKELAKVLQKPLWLPNIPQKVMELVLGEMAYLLFASQRVSSKRIEKKGFSFTYNNVCQALEQIYGGVGCEESTETASYESRFS
ncbi:MAG: TIGR01777 family oxidoreductase [Bacteroidota bacterium]